MVSWVAYLLLALQISHCSEVREYSGLSVVVFVLFYYHHYHVVVWVLSPHSVFCRIYSEEEESQASGLSDCNSQQYFGRGDSGTAEDIAFTEPMEWTHKQVHQLSANLHHPHLCGKTVRRGSSHIFKINSFVFLKQVTVNEFYQTCLFKIVIRGAFSVK